MPTKAEQKTKLKSNTLMRWASFRPLIVIVSLSLIIGVMWAVSSTTQGSRKDDPRLTADQFLSALVNCNAQKAHLVAPFFSGDKADKFNQGCTPGKIQYKFVKVLNADSLKQPYRDGQNAYLQYDLLENGSSNQVMVTLFWNPDRQQWFVFDINLTSLNVNQD